LFFWKKVYNVDEKKQTDQEKGQEVEVNIMAVSIKPAPVFSGDAAKKLLQLMENPKDNTAIFKKCVELAKQLKEKNNE